MCWSAQRDWRDAATMTSSPHEGLSLVGLLVAYNIDIFGGISADWRASAALFNYCQPKPHGHNIKFRAVRCCFLQYFSKKDWWNKNGNGTNRIGPYVSTLSIIHVPFWLETSGAPRSAASASTRSSVPANTQGASHPSEGSARPTVLSSARWIRLRLTFSQPSPLPLPLRKFAPFLQ
jgi:hypothetical protein